MQKNEIKKALFSVGIPVAVQNLISSSLNLIDTAMVSYVSEEALAAVTLANQVFFLMTLVTFGISSGSGAFLSQFTGKDDAENTKRTVSATLLISGSVGIVSMFLASFFGREIMGLLIRDAHVISLGTRYLHRIAPSYLFSTLALTLMIAARSVGKAGIAMTATFLAVVLNIVLDYLLIFGAFGFPQMGVEEAAIATSIARIFEFALMMFLIFRFESRLLPGKRHFQTLNKGFIFALLQHSLPVVMSESFWAMGIVLYTVFLAHIGQGAVSAFQVSRNLYNFFDVAFFGLASATSYLIGVSIGKGRTKSAKKIASLMMKYNLFASLGFSVLIFLLSPGLLRLYNLTPQTYETALSMIRIFGGFMFIKNTTLIFSVGIARGGGDTRYAMFADTIGVWGVGVPIVFISVFILKLDPVTVIFLLQTEEIVKCVFCIARLKNHRWIHDLTTRFEDKSIA